MNGSQRSTVSYFLDTFLYVLGAGAAILLLPLFFAVAGGLGLLTVHLLVWPYADFSAYFVAMLEAQRRATGAKSGDLFWSLWAQGFMLLVIYAAIGWPLRQVARSFAAKLRLQRVVSRLLKVKPDEKVPPALLDFIQHEQIGQKLDFEEKAKLPRNLELRLALEDAEDAPGTKSLPPKHCAVCGHFHGDDARVLTFSWRTFWLAVGAIVVGNTVAPWVPELVRELGALMATTMIPLITADFISAARAAVALAELTAVLEGLARWWVDRGEILSVESVEARPVEAE